MEEMERPKVYAETYEALPEVMKQALKECQIYQDRISAMFLAQWSKDGENCRKEIMEKTENYIPIGKTAKRPNGTGSEDLERLIRVANQVRSPGTHGYIEIHISQWMKKAENRK